jgi:hypothetical protein
MVIPIIDRFIKAHPEVTKVISGGATGVDTFVSEYCFFWGIEFEAIRPRDHKWGGPDGFEARNLKIARTCDMLLRIYHEGIKTKGSEFTAREAARLGKPVYQEMITNVAA